MTDNEIIEALRGSILNAKLIDCKVWSVELYKIEETLDLINRQKTENERLEKELMKCKLEKEMLYNVGVEIQTIAIKEFAERLKENYCFTDRWGKIITKSTVDNLVKEMTEVEVKQRKEDEGK